VAARNRTAGSCRHPPEQPGAAWKLYDTDVVSDYASIYLHGVEVYTWHEEVDPTFLFLFTSQDLHRRPTSDTKNDGIVRWTATAAVLRDRLDVLGVGREILESTFQDSVERWFQSSRDSDQTSRFSRDRVELLDGITLSAWAELLAQAVASARQSDRKDSLNPRSIVALFEIWEDFDPRLIVSAILLACSPDEEITLYLSEFLGGDWVDSHSNPQIAAIEHFSSSLVNGNPPVVITEGSTDANFLQAAIRIRYPHLQSFIKFFDFADGAEGSASAGVRTLKSFAAAGISNRVVLLLDNDTAARDALRALKGVTLPNHYSVLHYPDIDLALRYPTLGPNGLSEMDVNRLACSIELYLGADVLTQPDGQLSPVQWTSYIEGMRAYQGKVLHKADIQKRFREKERLASVDPEQLKNQDWTGLDAIVASLIELLRAPINIIN
jgi:HEPN/Toprim N-terminal domain 1